MKKKRNSVENPCVSMVTSNLYDFRKKPAPLTREELRVEDLLVAEKSIVPGGNWMELVMSPCQILLGKSFLVS